MRLIELRKISRSEIFDYNLLMSFLKKYKAPHRKITQLLKTGEIIRIKKGLYAFGEIYRQGPVHRELIANLLSGPSYISLEYALSHYGFIPERVETVTSMTPKRNKSFSTPFGHYTYHYLNLQRYTMGVIWQPLPSGEHYLIATPEKALIDTIAFCRDITSEKEIQKHLIENLRIEMESLKQLNLKKLNQIAEKYHNPPVNLLNKILKRIIQ